MTDVFGKTITDADICIFAGVSGDTNPVHLNDDFAKKSMFKTRTSATACWAPRSFPRCSATELPGPGCIYVSQTLKFKAPVRVGDTMIARVTVRKLIPNKKFVEFDTVVTVAGKPVIEGEAIIMVPSKG